MRSRPAPAAAAVKPSAPVKKEGRLRFYVAPEFTIVARTPFGAFKLFKITFGRDGSIYVPFPYMDKKRGILAEADPASESDPRTLNLRRNGTIVDYDVKFSHHTSGVVQFSKSGEPAHLPRRQSFPLTAPFGRLFEFRLYGLRGFAKFDGKAAKRALAVPFFFPDRHPTALLVAVEWRRKADILNNSTGNELGPLVNMVRRGNGAFSSGLLLGQPTSSPLQEHVLLVSAGEILHADGADHPTSVFLGGWDAHEETAPSSARMLVFLYPIH